MLLWFSVRMSNGKDDCWTMQEAKSELGARNITNMKWGKSWRAVEAKEIANFYQEQNADSAEDLLNLNKQRGENMIKANCKAVVTPEGEFDSMKDALAHFKTRAKLKALMEKYPNEYYFKQ